MFENFKEKFSWRKPNRRKPSEFVEQEKVPIRSVADRDEFLMLTAHIPDPHFLDNFNLLPEELQKYIIADIVKKKKKGMLLNEISARLELLVEQGFAFSKMNGTYSDKNHRPDDFSREDLKLMDELGQRTPVIDSYLDDVKRAGETPDEEPIPIPKKTN
ncbi:MAG: hypothetical protein AAB786_00785 [Patescibacteria group bacterium]